MAKYKVGDKVRVRKDLNKGDQYYLDDKSDYWYATVDMIRFADKIVTIKEFVGYGYIVEELEDCDYWTCDMFVGLDEEERKYKFKVGDMVIANSLATCYSITKEGWIGTVTEVCEQNFKANNKEYPDGFFLLYDKFDLYNPAPEPTPTAVNINVTVNLYENACWYCRKGGLVDLYLAGAMGICPSCGRVCNNRRGG